MYMFSAFRYGHVYTNRVLMYMSISLNKLTIKLTLMQNKSRGLMAMHLKEITKPNHVQLKSRISPQWFTQNVF